ncbi:MAG: hypothetical protein ACYC0M_10475 [Burkholderiales bacterium]
MKNAYTEEQRVQLFALAVNPRYARKLLSAIESSPKLANFLWDVCVIAQLTLAFS